MPRTKSTAANLVEDMQFSEDLSANQNEMAIRQQEVMAQFGDGLPYERDRIVHEARFYMAQSAEAMLEAGKRLVILKENEPHGDFTNILEIDLGLAPQVARRMMQASIKFLGNSSEPPKRSALSVLGKTKLYELMVLDDEELDALAEGGTIAGTTLDEIDRMTSRELKTALREARDDADAQRRILSDKNTKIDDLTTRLQKQSKIKPPAPDVEAEKLRKEVTSIAFEAEAIITGKLREGFRVLTTYITDNDAGEYPDAFMAGLLNQLQQSLNKVRENFNLEDFSAGNRPEWIDAPLDLGQQGE
ncbi:DUF3102 domain-containing protein [Serratia marcescens]|uniref:DUF3102 domain-containing protein n=1 Tax=Serratia marcescens TaxID=615 RepID=UPI0027E5528D|nr:DUF3102 domain-containing protein [Serratia marcescens]HCL5501380.1 DUF3102 domain-containing protein [Klebsiella pneumoniae]EJC0203855.1 DUF3102 domain-containing protein [Serratia marcescens]WLS21843.1 DUF3102 domain-containing protein [Serratia marcescens]HCB1481504.1 DUF3102 domain-containing protein [Serratia marcescens]HCB1611197.1 DUF3102 domain-containing protein [Serratia marcescens]